MARVRKFWVLLLLCAAASWGAISIELEPQQPEQGEEFSFSLLLPAGELPPDHRTPELEYSEGVFELLRSEAKEEERRDFFMGRYRVKKFHYKMKALREGEHRIALFWEYSGQRHSIGTTRVTVQRSLDAAGLSISTHASKKNLWEGEQFSLSIRLNAYRNFRQDLGAASLDFGSGFWGGLSDNNPEWKRTDGSGSVVATRDLVAHLVPMRSGAQTIPPFRFRYLKEGRPQRKVEEKQTVFGMSRFERITQEPQEATALGASVELTVRPLPQEGKPALFSGLVGEYTLSAQLNSDSTEIGSPVTLQVVVTGNGRPGATPQLQLPDLRDFRQVPPEEKISSSIRKGEKWTTWSGKWFLYPRRPGTFEIGPVRFSYFDPTTGRYKTNETAPFSLVVERNSGAFAESDSAPATPSSGVSKEIRALGSDIRYIRSDADRLRDGEAWPHRNPFFWLTLLLLLALPAGVAGGRELWRRTLLDPDRQRRSRARAAARGKLREAAAACDATPAHPFYNALERALLEGVAEAIDAEPRGMARHALAERLISHGLSGEASQRLLQLLDCCDAARFSASDQNDTTDHRKEKLEQAEETLTNLWRIGR